MRGFRDLFPDLFPLDAMLLGCVTRARIHQLRHEDAKTAELLAQTERIGEERGAARALGTIQLERVRLALQRGDPAAAEREARGLDRSGFLNLPAEWSSPANDPETPEVGSLRLLIRTGKGGRALPRLREELRAAEVFHRHRRALKVRILLSEALAAAGEKKAALRVLREALQLGSREGYLRAFSDEGAAVLSLLRDLRDARGAEGAAEQGGTEYLDRILAAAREQSPASPVGAVPAAWPVEGLTDRELEILRLTSAGHSNRALAEQLLVSVATIKYHLRNINLKLHAANRTEAIAKARRFGLIP